MMTELAMWVVITDTATLLGLALIPIAFIVPVAIIATDRTTK